MTDDVEGGAVSEAATPTPAAGQPAASRRDQITVVGAALWGNLVSPTPIVYSGLSIFLIPITKDFGWPRERVSGVLILFALFTAMAYPFVGRTADRFGPRRPILVGSLLFGACVVALGFSNGNVFLFYALFAMIGAFGSLPSTMMYNRVISGWFDKTRGAMLGITAGGGNGAGATIMPMIALALMARFGWRGGFLGLGTIVLALGFPVLLFFLKEPPAGKADAVSRTAGLEGLSLAQAARTPSFWLLLTAICLGAGCLTGAMAHIVPMLTDRHFDPAQGVKVVQTFAIVTAIWQVVVGWLLDRTGSPKLVAPLYVVSVLGLLLLEHGTTMPALIGSGALLGIGMGTEYGVLPYFISRYFGIRRFGMIAGVMYAAVVVAQGITPFLMDVDFDHNRSYLLSLHVIDGLLLVGAAIIACLPAYAAAEAMWKGKGDPELVA